MILFFDINNKRNIFKVQHNCIRIELVIKKWLIYEKKKLRENILNYLNFKFEGVVQSWQGTELTSFNGEIQCDHRYEKDCNDWVTHKTNNNLKALNLIRKKK